jgi:IclR family transcriptional regulator, acetate operon repressor
MSVKEMKSDKRRERAAFARRATAPKAELNDVDRKSEMTSNNAGERAVAIDPPARSPGTAGKAERSDRLQHTSALSRHRLGEGGKPPRLGRGAVETPPVQSVERALSLLEAVARSPEPVPLANLTDVLGIDPSSVFRLANTLKRRGFLANPNGRKHYVLGPAVWRLSREYDWSRMLISICRESVKALAMRTGETAHLAVREGREVFFIDHYASGDQGVIVAGQTGKLMPLYCTAHGKALLADFGLAELKALYGTTPLERYTARTSVSLPDLAKACSSVRADGLSTDDGEYLEDVRCVAAPVRDQGGLVIGSIGVSAPATRMADGRDSVLAQHVRDTAEHINALLGV